jgi:hypothetical protein
MFAAVMYVVVSVYTSLNVPQPAEPVRYDDEEMGIYCYYYEDTMECFSPGEDMDDSVPEDERYESAINEL